MSASRPRHALPRLQRFGFRYLVPREISVLMRWQTKVLIQRVLSSLPGGASVNFLLQRISRRSWSVDEEVFLFRARLAIKHLNTALRHLNRPPSGLLAYEFGAGADLIAPLTLFGLGVPSQIVVDQDVLLRPSLVVDSCAKAGRHATDLALQRIPRVAATRSRSRMIRNLKTATGIDYRAPLDARRTGLAAASVDLVTSNSTLEHVPRQELLPLMSECRRVLKDTGVVCVRIDYEDHFAGFDRDLSPYNFLRYSESEWRRFNSRLHYQNRLRHSDYVALFEEAGFSLLSVETLDPAPEAVGAAGRLGIHEEFRRYARADLLVRKGEFVLAKAGG